MRDTMPAEEAAPEDAAAPGRRRPRADVIQRARLRKAEQARQLPSAPLFAVLLEEVPRG